MKKSDSQSSFFTNTKLTLPTDYDPVRPDYFHVSRIYLAKDCISTPERRLFVERICKLYPEAEIKEYLDTPHNRIELPEKEPLALHLSGKNTLVFGQLKTSVRFSEESRNTCPNYWHFSPYGFCPYGCKYCFLAGTQGVKFSPTVKIYVNLPEMLEEIDDIARRIGKPTAFYIGKLQDALALDPLTHYSSVMIPFFANHPYARLTLLTKSTHVERLLALKHEGHSILSWSINPPEISGQFEENVPDVKERLEAMRKAASAGYPVRAVLMPIIPVDGWREIYSSFTKYLVESVPLQRLTLGGICSYKVAKRIMEIKLGQYNDISKNLTRMESLDGRNRYSIFLRNKIYSQIIKIAKECKPGLDIALCLEEDALWKSNRIDANLGYCNCVL